MRFALRCLGWTALGLAVPLVPLVLAWLPFNLPYTDAAPRPPLVEAPPSKRALPDERNAAFPIMALRAEPGRDLQATGRELWAAELAWSAMPAAQRAAGMASHDARRDKLLGAMVKQPGGAPMFCSAGAELCLDAWFADIDALAQQRQAVGVFGGRCDKVFGGAFEFEELVPPLLTPDTPLMGWSAVVNCSRWFRSGAVVALARGQRDKALEQLRLADRMHRVLFEGSQSLIGQMIAARMANWTHDTMAALALREPRLADGLEPWVAVPLDTRVGARRWMRLEAASHRGTVDYIVRDGMALPSLLAMPEYDGNPWGSGVLAAGALRLARLGIGLQSERTKQRFDAQWRREIDKLQLPWPAVLAGAEVERNAAARRSIWSFLRWRNTSGEAMADIGVGGVHNAYLARQADHELHREAAALVLALIRQRVAPAQRAQVARRIATSETLRDRTDWSADGRTMSVRTWQAETRGAGYRESRDAIVFTWP